MATNIYEKVRNGGAVAELVACYLLHAYGGA